MARVKKLLISTSHIFYSQSPLPRNIMTFNSFFTHRKSSLSVMLCLTLLFSAKSSGQSSHMLPVYKLLQTQKAVIVFIIQLFNWNKCRPCKGCAIKGDCKRTQSFFNLSSHTVFLNGCPDECLAGNDNNKQTKTKNGSQNVSQHYINHSLWYHQRKVHCLFCIAEVAHK